jgi:flagellar M-ring protein FliF
MKMLGTGDLKRLQTGLSALGPKKISALVILFLSTILVIVGCAYLISRPEFEVAYIGLNPTDTPRITRLLYDHGINFEVSTDGTRLLVRRGETSKVRATLAEKGLPSNPGTGYELFDKVGPLGLTTFMQEVTKIRALEGEITRSIHLLKGVRSARVHIAFGEPSSFRRQRILPSASVIIKTEYAKDRTQTEAVQHIVAAAVPGLTPNEVRVVSTDGQVLSSGSDDALAASNRLRSLEKAIAQDIQSNISKALVPQLGLEHFEVSANVRLNLDKRQTSETTYSPDGKAERSIRVTKEVANSQNNANKGIVGVEQNIPSDNQSTSSNELSRRSNQKKEELTNFEVGSKSTSVISDGHRIERVSVAVVLNSAKLMSGNSTSPAGLNTKRMEEIERVVASAAGIDASRGDIITVTAVEFIGSKAVDITPTQEGSVAAFFARETPLLIKIASTIIVTGLLIFFGLRPVTSALLAQTISSPALGQSMDMKAVAKGPSTGIEGRIQNSADDNKLPSAHAENPADLLQRLVDRDPARAASILRKWISDEREQA